MVEYIYDEDKRTTILADVKDAPTPIEKRVNPLIHTRKKRKNVKWEYYLLPTNHFIVGDGHI